jgi:hypothetical protein
MNQRSGRAYIFVRWSGFSNAPGRLGEVAWAFEYIDRLGRFVCFYCGAVGTAGSHISRDSFRATWTEKCSSLPELIKTMAGDAVDRPGYDEVKVFEVENADPDLALQAMQRSEEPNRIGNPLEETRDILSRYGARGLALSRGFSAPFLWYNILPGRSVAIRKLPVHLFQLRAASETQGQTTGENVEDQARRMAQSVSAVLSLGECFVARVRTGFIVGINIAVDPHLPVTESYKISQLVEEAVRGANPKIRHIFVQVTPHETV